MYTNIRLYMCAVFRFCASYSRIILNLPRSSYTDRLDKFFPMILDCFDLPLLYRSLPTCGRSGHRWVMVPHFHCSAFTRGWKIFLGASDPQNPALHSTSNRALAINLHVYFWLGSWKNIWDLVLMWQLCTLSPFLKNSRAFTSRCGILPQI